MCSPSKRRGSPSRPSQRSSRFGTTAFTVGRNRIGRVPDAPRRTSSREPTCALPWIRRMNGFQSGNLSKSIRTAHTSSACASISISVRSSNIALSEESGGLQLLRDLLNGLLDIRGLAGPRAHELAAAEQEDDHLRHVDPIHEPGELLRLVLDLLEAERDRNGIQIDLRSEVRGRDDVLDLDHWILLDRDACGLDLLRDHVNRGLDVLEAFRSRADDLPAPEQEGRSLRFLQSIDESGELLRFVFSPAEGKGDRLEVELLPEGGRGDDVLNLDFGQRDTTISLPAWRAAKGFGTEGR